MEQAQEARRQQGAKRKGEGVIFFFFWVLGGFGCLCVWLFFFWGGFLSVSFHCLFFRKCGWRGYEREEKEGEREVDNLSTCGCVIQLYLWENTQFIEIREFGWGFLMLTS